MTTRCSRCHRLTREPVFIGGSPYGWRCALALAGQKNPRIKTERHTAADPAQSELWERA